MLARTESSDHGRSERNSDDGQRNAVFARANRHSNVVRALKWVLPGAGLLLAGGFVVASQLSTTPKVEVKADPANSSQGPMVMANPTLHGFTKDKLPYAVSALRAVQNGENSALVALEKIAAKLPLDANRVATLETEGGIFDQSRNTLSIDKPISIKTSDGMSVDLGSALIDVAAGTMSTDKPVDIAIKGGRLRSDKLSVEKNGRVVLFQQNVRVNIDPAAISGGAPDNGGKNAGD